MKSKLFASLLGLGMLMCAGNAFAEPECVTAFGKTACGYNCVSGYGDVKCARTPQGECTKAYGDIVCWDPDIYTYQKAECVNAYGDIVCGYDCVSAYGQIKCAQTPDGACTHAYGDVVCWDPSYRTYQKAECVEAYGEIACGYNCVAAYGEVKCAGTPNSVCRSEFGTINCYEF